MKRLIAATILASLSLSGMAWADDDRDDYWEDRREDRKERLEEQREHEKERREAWREHEKDRREARREYEKDRREYEKDRREAEREYRRDRREAEREYRRWARGEYIPRDYLYDRYYIRDYRAYDLPPPQAGYHWVRPHEGDDTYYLVQAATGLILQILGE